MPGSSLVIDDRESRRQYFRTFVDIIERCRAQPVELVTGSRKGALSLLERTGIDDYLDRLRTSFAALSARYRRVEAGADMDAGGAGLTIDRSDSGYPVFQEIVQLGIDLNDAAKTLAALPNRRALKAGMLDHLLTRRTLPRALQSRMSRRIYCEILAERVPFLPINAPEIVKVGNRRQERRAYLIRWAVYDTHRNMPNIYLLGVEETGAQPLMSDEKRWRRLAKHLTAQSLSTLKLLTIARGLDKDFSDIHPKRLRRIHFGPMYSNRFTRHADVVQDLLSEPEPGSDQDWVFCWTVETLRSKGSSTRDSGLFSQTVSEIYDFDVHAPDEIEAGASKVERGMILPYRPYQRLVERDLPQLRPLRKYVVGPDGLLLKQG